MQLHNINRVEVQAMRRRSPGSPRAFNGLDFNFLPFRPEPFAYALAWPHVALMVIQLHSQSEATALVSGHFAQSTLALPVQESSAKEQSYCSLLPGDQTARNECLASGW